MSVLPPIRLVALVCLFPLPALSQDQTPGTSTNTPEANQPAAHYYFTMDELAAAQQTARQKHWVLAWIDAWPAALSNDEYQPGCDTDLAQNALKHLKGRAVIVYVNGAADLPRLSPIIRDQQLFQLDDGPLPDGHHFLTPKIVFSDADVTKGLGRVANKQLRANGMSAIDTALAAIATASAGQFKIGDPADEIFPAGKKTVKLSSFVNPPTTGVQFNETNDDMHANGLSKDQVIVACDGIQVENISQYSCQRESSDSPNMTLIVWDGHEYQELKVNQPGRKFGVDIHDYKP